MPTTARGIDTLFGVDPDAFAGAELHDVVI